MSKVGVNWMFITGEIFYIICWNKNNLWKLFFRNQVKWNKGVLSLPSAGKTIQYIQFDYWIPRQTWKKLSNVREQKLDTLKCPHISKCILWMSRCDYFNNMRTRFTRFGTNDQWPQYGSKWKMTSIFFQMEDNLNYLENGRQPQSLLNGIWPNYFGKWKTTSIFW